MKKILVSAVLVLTAVFAFAAGNKEQMGDKTIVLRLGDNHPDGYPTVVGDLEFARLVKERSNGRIVVEVYNNGVLGDQKSVVEQVQFGGIDFVRTSISSLAAFYPDINALQAPYLFRNADHMWKVLNGEIGDYFLNSVKSNGFIGLCWFDAGARSFYNTKKPIYTVADLKGMKIRVQESSLMMGMIQALGAVPTPMPYGDVYSALQTGVIDGAENNWPSYDTASHYEVARYFSIDEHTRVPEMILASKITMDKLSAEDQALILKAAKDAAPVQIKAWADMEKRSEDKVRAAGCKINTIKNQAEFSAAMAPLYDSFSAGQKEWIKKIQAVK
ncbi:TRAP transporter substrate-binding protein [Treponema lecithinolyticum]|jgi:TRAP transporter solute receptor, dctP family|uniref:TRAP transporter substrate-binding protein n=1 Tax=Treponema lecithinolyticum TaxID=53418 RepID=UPI0028EDF7C4|nr:TRAP transporter substrate-binding protein [Treponema lecithinolyticum]